MIKSFAKISFACLLILTIASCERKSCKDVTCPVNQACNNGRCFCADGLEGTDCNTASYTKYVDNNRNWIVTGSCNIPNFQPYSTYFLYDGTSAINTIWIVNLFPQQIYAYIRTDQTNQGNILEIPAQNYDGTNTVSGQGAYNTVNGTPTITFNLDFTYNGVDNQCSVIFR